MVKGGDYGGIAEVARAYFSLVEETSAKIWAGLFLGAPSCTEPPSAPSGGAGSELGRCEESALNMLPCHEVVCLGLQPHALHSVSVADHSRANDSRVTVVECTQQRCSSIFHPREAERRPCRPRDSIAGRACACAIVTGETQRTFTPIQSRSPT